MWRECIIAILIAKNTQIVIGDFTLFNSEQTCFDNLGCFSYNVPWRSELRPIPRPSHPETYKASLDFYARDEDRNGRKILLYPEPQQTTYTFRAGRSLTVFILPGTAATDGGVGGTVTWPIRMKNAILKRVDANVFIGNNTGGTFTIDLFLAAANAPVVAKHYSNFITGIKGKTGLDGGRIWIIGFGDGAHIAGYVGKDTHIARITALDPAQQLYEGHPSEVRLSKADADYVDVVHSDARPAFPDIGEGYMASLGDVDFYLNGGHLQPGCRLPRPFELIGYPTLLDAIKEPVRLVALSFLCAHKLSHRVFIAALEITNCTFWGHPGTYENMMRSLSNAGTQGVISEYTALKGTCDLQTCVPLGYDSPKSMARGVFFITTDTFYPYCMDRSKVVPETQEYLEEIAAAQYASEIFQSNKQIERQEHLKG